MKEEKQKTVFFEHETTVGILLNEVELYKKIYLCVSGWDRSLEISEKVIGKLDQVLKLYQEKFKAIKGSDKIAEIEAEVVKITLAKVTKDELKEGTALKILRINPLFLHNFKYLIE